jgi:myo-inositol 2-dehydrogenase/D-chiro-inositol 1-dehydrogenase
MSGSLSRREFIVGSSVATASLLIPRFAHASGSDTIKVGLIGCGGRGTGAAANCVESSPGVVIYAMGDLFPDRLAGSRDTLKGALKEAYQVPDDRAFTGWDAYKKVLAQPVDMVILATPPGFRPIHLAAAIEAGKHIFMEKPVATDAPGIRSIIESSDKAAAKGLAIVCGTQRRHDLAYNEAMKRIHDGAIGDVASMNVYWNQGGLWMNTRQPNWSDMEWQLRNWLYFTWLSGDMITEQHIHNIDIGNWAMNTHPVKAVSLAGRQVRTDPAYGHIFDHFATEFEYANGVKMVSMCRQIDGTDGNVSEWIVGTKGRSDGNNWISGPGEWKWAGERPNPYMLEHRDLIASIRAGKPLNEGRRIAETTMTAIMGRMAGYTGKVVTWDQAINSQEKLVPDTFAFGPMPVPPVATPGVTKLS